MPDQIKVPSSLKLIQSEFAKIITTPFGFHDESGEHIFPVENYSESLLEKINDQKDISASERLLFYHKAYWYRLITLLQEDMPLMLHLLGYNEFNRFAMNYLHKFPSDSNILNYLCDSLADFMKLDHDWRSELFDEAVSLEFIYIKSFDAKSLSPLDPQKLTQEEIETLPTKIFKLQPHTFLYEENWNLKECRDKAKETENDDLILKPLKQQSKWIIYRSLGNALISVKLDTHQWNLLSNIKKGFSFNDAIEQTFADCLEEEIEEVAPNIQSWFSEWVSWGIFSLES